MNSELLYKLRKLVNAADSLNIAAGIYKDAIKEAIVELEILYKNMGYIVK